MYTASECLRKTNKRAEYHQPLHVACRTLWKMNEHIKTIKIAARESIDFIRVAHTEMHKLKLIGLEINEIV